MTMPDFDKEEVRTAVVDLLKSGDISAQLIKIVKEAIKEWLDDRAADLGWFCWRWIGRVVFAVIVFMAVKWEIK